MLPVAVSVVLGATPGLGDHVVIVIKRELFTLNSQNVLSYLICIVVYPTV